MSSVFLYKDNLEDRDCCVYIKDKPMRFECDHYFGSVNLQGSRYSGSKFADYHNIKTVLSEEDYKALIIFSENIQELGYGITKGDARYKRGVELCDRIQPVYDKLLSEANESLFQEVQEEEKEYLMDEFNLDDSEVDDIFNNYYLEYRDRSIVSAVYNDSSDLGYEEAFNLGYVSNDDTILSRYFDYEKFGEDLLEEDRYYQLDDGRVVCFNY